MRRGSGWKRNSTGRCRRQDGEPQAGRARGALRGARGPPAPAGTSASPQGRSSALQDAVGESPPEARGAACCSGPRPAQEGRPLLTHQLVAAGRAAAGRACPVCRALCAHRAR